MKKKTEKKKLVLAKETVQSLEAGGLRNIVGGSGLLCSPSYPYRCPEDPASNAC